MMDELLDDAQLSAALEKVQNRKLASLPDDPPKHEFSEEFRNRMQKLFRYEKRMLFLQTASKRVAAALLAIVVGVSLLITLDSEARAATLAWIKEELGRYSVFGFTDESTSELPDCTFTWLPNGMKCVTDESTFVGRTLLYLNEENPNDGFTLYYELMNKNTGLIVDKFDIEYTVSQVKINGNSGELYISQNQDECHLLVWFDENNNVAFLITSFFKPEVILHIAEGVVLGN